MKKPLIGVSCAFFHPTSERNLFKNKRLIYVEQQLVTEILRHGAIPVPIIHPENVSLLGSLLEPLSGVVMSGGDDVSPLSYAESALKPEWQGDFYRDEYELKILQESIKRRLPILGVCRGLQILNVYFGGSLYQDISTQKPGSLIHRDREIYDQLNHKVSVDVNSDLYDIYKEKELLVNTVHHQAIKKLGKGLVPVAQAEDGIIEAVESASTGNFLMGIQWHPEWCANSSVPLVKAGPLFNRFMKAVLAPPID